jgi:hypothetical protein
MPARLRRCGECEAGDVPYCAHRGVLRVWLEHGGVQLFVKGATEEAARRAADKARIAFQGAPFRHKPSDARAVRPQ